MGDDSNVQLVAYDLVQRCNECDFCILEQLLAPSQRSNAILEHPIPERHPHRELIEQVCGRQHDEPCKMKYVFMRSGHDDFMAAQLGAMNIAAWDLGIRKREPVGYEEAFGYWMEERDMGRGMPESYAKRFREIWNTGLRGDKQSLTTLMMYEAVVSTNGTYDDAISLLNKLGEESEKRNSGALTI